MAQQQIGNLLGVKALNDKALSGNLKTNLTGSTVSQSSAFPTANYVDLTAMATRLAAIDSGFYTATKLNKMTFNDMVYAIRKLDSPTSIKA